MVWSVDTSDPQIRIIIEQEVVMLDPSNWTVERVKAEMPDIEVKMPTGVTVTAKVCGSKKRFATLKAKSAEWGVWVTLGECRWDVLAHCLNMGRPLEM